MSGTGRLELANRTIEYRLREGRSGEYRWFLARALPVRGQDGAVSKWFGTYTDINAQKEFERMREDFLASTAHDLKTPLTTIKGTAHVLRRAAVKGEIDPTTIARGLEQVDEMATRLARQIDGLLDLARMQAGESL